MKNLQATRESNDHTCPFRTQINLVNKQYSKGGIKKRVPKHLYGFPSPPFRVGVRDRVRVPPYSVSIDNFHSKKTSLNFFLKKSTSQNSETKKLNGTRMKKVGVKRAPQSATVQGARGKIRLQSFTICLHMLYRPSFRSYSSTTTLGSPSNVAINFNSPLPSLPLGSFLNHHVFK